MTYMQWILEWEWRHKVCQFLSRRKNTWQELAPYVYDWWPEEEVD